VRENDRTGQRRWWVGSNERGKWSLGVSAGWTAAYDLKENEDDQHRHHLEPLLPRLRRYARTLTRNEPGAEDLLQSTILRALEKQHHYRVDANLRVG